MLCDQYISALIKEIMMVGSQNAEKKEVTTLYFGGGTPALAVDRLQEVINTVNQYFTIKEGIGIELHPEEISIELLKKLKAAGVTKISIGIQSFKSSFLTMLGREVFSHEKMFEAIQTVQFETVSMDFIFALPGQTFEDLKYDIDTAFSNGANHIAIYPFIDFSFANSGIDSMAKKQKKALLDEITYYCKSKDYHRESIWTFSNQQGAQYSSMTRDHFLGFGCSATTLLKHQFKINTFSIPDYIQRIEKNQLATSLTLRFTKKQRMIYYLFWTAYSTTVEAEAFQEFFGSSLKSQYGIELWLAKRLGLLTEQNGIYEMTLKGAFYYHYYENYYTLSYIDKMWGIMRKEAFPAEIVM
jgi:oxygen-independent coproporphyrinogen-3 oxidase